MYLFIVSNIIYGLWFLSEVAIFILLRSQKDDKKHADKGSVYLIWVVFLTSIFSAIYVSYLHQFQLSANNEIVYFGLFLIILGVILRLLVIKTLGQFFTVDVAIRHGHHLKKGGFYKYLRHPSYSASLISFIGFGISLNNWISIILVTIPIFIAYIIRIKIEENTLIGYFGNEYSDYMKVTKRIIPFIY